MRKKIVHIIYDLGRGGAETMLLTVVKELKEYENVIVTLFSPNHFTKEELVCDKYISLGLTSVKQMPGALLKMRKIIKQEKPDIVHTHLFWPTVLARIVVPRKIPLITTIHAFIATSGEYKFWYIKWIDKITYHFRKSVIITVAKGALTEYFSFLKLKPWRSHALYTFVNTALFNAANSQPAAVASPKFRLITVGRISLQKNHRYLVEAFKLLPPGMFELHIYGNNSLGAAFEQYATENDIGIVLKGEVKNINQIISQYDLFVMSSTYEGFSLAVLEAMAMGVPMLLSDISSFREQCADTAVYFNLDNPQDFVNKLQQLAADKATLQTLAAQSKTRVLVNFTLEHHMQGLRKIYDEQLAPAGKPVPQLQQPVIGAATITDTDTQKKIILHLIHDLGRGGAETILVKTVKELTEYRNIVVTIGNTNHFGAELECDDYICLNIRHPFLLPFYIFRLRKIIRQYKVDMVHSRLFWANLLARIGMPRRIPLVTTIHAYIAGSLEYKKWYIRFLDKLTYRFHKTYMMADSAGALQEYFSFLGLQPYKAVSPFTFVDTNLFDLSKATAKPPQDGTVRLVSVGRLTRQKNYQYLVEAFKQLKGEKIELHIYGMNLLFDELQQSIESSGVKVILKGQVTNIHELISGYDIFVMPSLYEGFSLAVLEAMAMGMPLMLSDIPSFREQCADTAIYFDLADPADFVHKLKALLAEKNRFAQMGAAAKDRAVNNFTLPHHMQIVRQFYLQALAGE